MGSHGSSLQLLCVVSLVLILKCQSFPKEEVWALAAFKEAIYEDPRLVLSNWDTLDGDPCGWNGISCSVARNHVLKINISGSYLRGFLASELGQITRLQQLILHGNDLIGLIPKELGVLKYLTVLDLGNNKLTGPIPPELSNLTMLTKLNLQSNGLTGSLPPEIGNLRNLEELRLDRNRLEGAVPANSSSDSTSGGPGMYASQPTLSGLCQASRLKVADLSYNFFSGNVPKCLLHLPSAIFQGNCLLTNVTKQRATVQCGAYGSSDSANAPSARTHHASSPKHQRADGASEKQQDSMKPSWLRPLEIATGTTLCSLCIIIVLLVGVKRYRSKLPVFTPWKKSGSQKECVTVYLDSEFLKGVVRFSRQELEVACEDFSNIIGSSPDSIIYKGNIKGGPEIAVISLCVSEAHWTGYLELYYQREVADLARLNHGNTGKLLGYCKESSPFSRMLVFEYTSNGTLYEHLHCGEGCQLSWGQRMKIIMGIANGLKYLHTELNPPFTISELDSNSVYLTEDFSPKLVDFESWKSILTRSVKNSSSISGQGDICVLPNSMVDRHLDVKGNVYAFGVLLLEIISGRPPYCKEKRCIVDWAKEFLELPEVMSYMVDPELKHFRYEDLKVLCEVVNLCINPDATSRPCMQEVSSTLENRLDMSMSVKASSLAWAELALLT